MMDRINYKDDFKVELRLRDSRGESIGWPAWDWMARLYTSQRVNAVTASSIGGVLTRCYRGDDDAVIVTLDSHGLSPGRLHVEFTALLPDSSFPDGSQARVIVADPEVELVRGESSPPSQVAVDVAVSFAQLNAYDQAVAAGFPGTMDEYYSGLAMLPSLSRLTADLASGKSAIAALTAQGVPTDPAAPLASMSGGVRRLYAVPTADAGSVDSCLRLTDSDTSAAFDIRNIVGRHRRAEFPCTCGATFALSSPSREVTLPACDAVELSDGTALHEVALGTVVTLGGEATAAWAVFHFREDFFAWPWLGGAAHHDLCAVGCHPCFSTSSTQGFVRLLTDASPADYDGHDFAFASGAGDIADSAVEALPTGSSLVSGPAVRSIRMASLKSTRRIIANGCANLTHLELPALETASATIANSCAALTHLELPALENVQGLSGYLIISCQKLTHICFPALQSFSASLFANMIMDLIDFPALKSCSGTMALNLSSSSSLTINFPVLESSSQNFCIGSNVACRYIVNAPRLLSGSIMVTTSNTGSLIVNLGAQVGASLSFNKITTSAINILPGFTGNLSFPNATNITADNLRELLANLGDNSDGPTYRIQMGATNLAKLTDEEIAVATAKNYTLS